MNKFCIIALALLIFFWPSNQILSSENSTTNICYIAMENVQYNLLAQVPNLKVSAISTCTIGGSWKSWLKLFASHSKFCLKMCYSQFYRWIPYPHHMTLLPDAMESVHTFAVFPLNCSRETWLTHRFPRRPGPMLPVRCTSFSSLQAVGTTCSAATNMHAYIMLKTSAPAKTPGILFWYWHVPISHCIQVWH